MQDIYRELKRDPRYTIFDAFNLKHKRRIPYWEFVITDIVNKGKEATFTISAAEGAMDVVAATSLTIPRINIADFIKEAMRHVEIKDLSSTNDILAALQSPHVFFYDGRDFMIEYIDPAAKVYTLKTMPDSLRWYGTVDITLAKAT